jgi:Lrp/AsnC family transcriptional regulator, leucine-responsive regulatory protein
MTLDRLDAAILSKLLDDGRATMLEVSESVGLSPSACARRVKQLEDCGYITGAQATVDLGRLGLPVLALVTFTLTRQTEETLQAFEEAVLKCPPILWCYLMSGSSDYIAGIAARDINHFEAIHKSRLSRLPGVATLQSSFALREVVRRPAPSDLRAELARQVQP